MVKLPREQKIEIYNKRKAGKVLSIYQWSMELVDIALIT